MSKTNAPVKPLNYQNSAFSIYERDDDAFIKINIPLRLDNLNIKEFEEYEKPIQDQLRIFTNAIFQHIPFLMEVAEEKDLHSIDIRGILDLLGAVGLGLSEAKELVRMNFEKAKTEVKKA